MKATHKNKPLTFGQLIAAVYHIAGKRQARSLVQLAVNAHVVTFRGHRQFIVS